MLSTRESYSTITGDELDVLVKEILRGFINSGYKSMCRHLLARGIKLQENREREVMRRVDPEGVLVRAVTDNSQTNLPMLEDLCLRGLINRAP